ncbi:hypothetical protein ABW21_db0202510 [Orbilia brochopaga]|nr:hypothetical protein ABW21_db0202510 [Drechslerella brochopaga]
MRLWDVYTFVGSFATGGYEDDVILILRVHLRNRVIEDTAEIPTSPEAPTSPPKRRNRQTYEIYRLNSKMGNVEGQDKPPGYEAFPPTVNAPPTASTSAPPQPSGIQNMLESAGVGDAARRVEGASDYLRHTLMGFVDRVAGYRDAADEKDRLAAIGYDQMSTGKRREPVDAPRAAPDAERVPESTLPAPAPQVPGETTPLFPADKK